MLPDGRTVGALLSREVADDKRPGDCIRAADNGCWPGDILAARTVDMRQSHIVASQGDKRAPNDRRYDAFTTSHIAQS